MPKETIGYSPETAIKPIALAEMPEARINHPTVETETIFTNLNRIDQRLLNIPEGIFNAIAVNMASKGISSDQITSNL